MPLDEKFWTRIGHFGKLINGFFALNLLILRNLWWSRWDSNPRPLRCESDYRQNAKYLPFKSCSHQEKSMVFPFFPIPYHRVHVASCFFWPRIGHLEIRSVGAFLEDMSRPSPFYL